MTFPRFRLYQSDGTTLVYEFDCVTNIVDNQDPVNFVEHQALRGKGSRIIGGSESSWDLTMTFNLTGDDYEDLTAQIDTVKSSILKLTKYVLKVDKTTGGATEDYKVMRLQTMEFPIDASSKKRVNIQPVNIVFRTNTWS